MEKLNFEFDYWEYLKKYISETYPNKITFLYDPEVSYFDADDLPLIKPRLYSFESVEEFIEWCGKSWEEGGEKINIVEDLSVLFIYGVMDEEVIYKLRG